MKSLVELQQISVLRYATQGLIGLVAFVLINACRQILFRPKTEPPSVFHWIPYIGNAVSYGMDPVGFFHKYRAKAGFRKRHLTFHP